MAVQRYSRQEMTAIIGNILKRDVTLLPIGNHELRRHLVYRVKTHDGDFVFKYYYQDIYGGREISTLNLLHDTEIKHAHIIDSGTFGEEREWLMMELLDGMPMDKVMHHISEEELLSIYRDMGRELGKLHELKTFQGFGNLKHDGSFVEAYSTFKDAFMANNKYAYDKIKNGQLESKDILLLAIKKVEKNLFLLDDVTKSHLTHFDFSPRNIFIHKIDHKWALNAVLDFELCRPWDKNADLVHLMLRDFPENPKFEAAFFKGYNEYSSMDHSFYKTSDLYLLNQCISVCSWAKDIAPNYYELAINRLIKVMNESKNLK